MRKKSTGYPRQHSTGAYKGLSDTQKLALRKKAVELFECGAPYNDVAQAIGVSWDTVRKWYKLTATPEGKAEFLSKIYVKKPKNGGPLEEAKD